jgi:hypothetical protein
MAAHIITIVMARNKKHSKKYLIISKFNLRLVVVLLLIFAALSVYELRQNNLGMISLKNQLMVADKNNGNVNGDINKLRSYIYSHMNTSPSSGANGIYPPIQLKYTYQRLLANAQAQVSAQNGQIYAQAVAYCNNLMPNYSPTEANLQKLTTCEEQYYEAQPRATAYVAAPLYEFDFVSPFWSPDLAGFSILITIGLLVALIAMYLFDRFGR